jgi:maltooligosyltrehalose synthase
MDISLKSLEEAVSVRRQIATLEKRLDSLLGASPSTTSTHRGKRGMSARARAKIAAAMRARWAKRKGGTAVAKTVKRKGGITAAGRKRLSQLMKARWAARRKAGKK